MKPRGTNTAAMTSVMAMTAGPTSRSASTAAALALPPCSWRLACTASTTTIALSTTMPIANTSANRVMRLSEKPNPSMKSSDPTSEVGTAMSGITVERQSCRKIPTTTATKMKASMNVLARARTEASKKRLTSKLTS